MAPVSETLPIVVGFDYSTGAVKALTWAAREALVRKAEVKVVEAWRPGEFGDPKEIVEFRKTKLDEAVAEQMDGIDVKWSAVVEEGSPARVLLHEGEAAQMVVVGSRGHGTLAGLVLGSVSTQVATHDGAPVVVIVRD